MNIFKRAKIMLNAKNELVEIAPFIKIKDFGDNIFIVSVVDPEDKYLFDVGFFDDRKNDAGRKAAERVYDVLCSVGLSDIEPGAVQHFTTSGKVIAAAYRIPVDSRHVKNMKILNKIMEIKQNMNTKCVYAGRVTSQSR